MTLWNQEHKMALSKSESLAKLQRLEEEIDNATDAIDEILDLMNKYNAKSSNNGLKISYNNTDANDFPQLPYEAQKVKKKLKSLRNLYAGVFPEEFAKLDQSKLRSFSCFSIEKLLYSTDLHVNLHAVRKALNNKLLDIKEKKFDILGSGLDTSLLIKAKNAFSTIGYDRILNSQTTEDNRSEEFIALQEAKKALREAQAASLSGDRSSAEEVSKEQAGRGNGSAIPDTSNSSFVASTGNQSTLGRLFGIEIGPVETPKNIMDSVTQAIILAQNPGNAPFCNPKTEKEFQNSFSEEVIESRNNVVSKKNDSSSRQKKLSDQAVNNAGRVYSVSIAYVNRIKDIRVKIAKTGAEATNIPARVTTIEGRMKVAKTLEDVKLLTNQLQVIERELRGEA